MHRVIHIAASFAIVLTAYFAYSLIAVPLIEPTGPLGNFDGGNDTPVGFQSSLRQAQFAEIFPPGAWEHDAKVLQSDQFKLLVQKYENQGDGIMKITPCTMIFTPGDPDDSTPDGTTPDGNGRAAPIILQAPQGAILTFDGPINLKQLKLGKIIGGRFLGRVTVFSHGTEPGTEDDLMFITDDMQLSKDEVHTTHPVQFRYGPHYGSGREMVIKLGNANAGGNAPENSRGPKIGGIQSLELKHLEQFHLEISGDELDGAEEPGGKKAVVAQNKKAGDKKTMPVEVACRGPFRIDLVDNVITFEDQVDVMRFYPEGLSDQINCELLSVFLVPKDKPATKKNKGEKPGLDGMEPRRIEARGNPVIVRSPRNDMEARGQSLEYDMSSGRILLDRRPNNNDTAKTHKEVFLRQGPNEIHAVSLQYEPAKPAKPDKGQRQIGRLVAQGPGWFRGQMGGNPADPSPARPTAPQTAQTDKKRQPQIIEATWKDLLRLRPDNQYQAISPQDKFQTISLAGDATLNFPGFGQLSADEIHFWMIEAPPGPKKAQTPALRPHSMLACGKQRGNAKPSEMNKVKINSPQLTAVVDKLQVWFEERAEHVAANRPQPPTGRVERPASVYAQTTPVIHAAHKRPIPTPNTTAAGSASPTKEAKKTKGPKNHFHVVGRLLKASVTLGEQAELSTLTISGDVRLDETKTAQSNNGLPDEEPLIIQGDKIIVSNASRPYAAVIVTGTAAKPAQFHGRGLGLIGASINLNRGTNRLWMDCPGTMTLPPMTRGLQGQPAAGAGPMAVHWQDSMEFDGRTVTFEQSVAASSDDQVLRTETLKVSLDQMVDFDQTSQLDSPSQLDGGNRRQPKVQEVRCRGGVTMQSRTFDEKGLLSTEFLTAVNLDMNNLSGNIYAAGPGNVTSVRRGTPNMNAMGAMPGRPQLAPVAGPVGNQYNGSVANKNGGDDEGISYLSVNFQHSITGNTFQRKINFHDQVRAVYGPVDTWASKLDNDDPDAVGPDGAILSCHRLSVISMQSPVDKRQSIELEAIGNTLIEGVLFTARGARMSFNQAKDLMILEGDGRNPATLYHQKIIGGPEENLHAGRIMYWPRTRKTTVEGAQSVELHLDRQSQEKFRAAR
jgi:hypothetical protein